MLSRERQAGRTPQKGHLSEEQIVPKSKNEQLKSLVYVLTDHLFAALEAGEKLRAARFTQPEIDQALSTDEILDEFHNLRAFITDLSDWEEELVTKTIQARKWSAYLKDQDAFFKPIIELFGSAVHPLSDIAAQIRDHHDRHFEGGDHPDWFIQSRALTVEKSTTGQILAITSGDVYLVGSTVRLGQLNELCETYLETLEARFPDLWLPSEDAILEQNQSKHTEFSEETF